MNETCLSTIQFFSYWFSKCQQSTYWSHWKFIPDWRYDKIPVFYEFFFFLPQKTKSLPTEILQVSTAMLQKSALEYRVRELVKSDGRG